MKTSILISAVILSTLSFLASFTSRFAIINVARGAESVCQTWRDTLDSRLSAYDTWLLSESADTVNNSETCSRFLTIYPVFKQPMSESVAEQWTSQFSNNSDSVTSQTAPSEATESSAEQTAPSEATESSAEQTAPSEATESSADEISCVGYEKALAALGEIQFANDGEPISDDRACALLMTGASVATIREYAQREDGDFWSYDEALAWMTAGFNGRSLGFSESDAHGYIPDGTGYGDFGDPQIIASAVKRARSYQASWAHTSFSPATIAAWRKAGISAKDAKSWDSAGFGPLDASTFKNELGVRPSTATTIRSQCSDGVGIGTLARTNPYDAKGHCYLYSGQVYDLLNRTQVLASTSGLSAEFVLVDFGQNSAPAIGNSFKAIIKIKDVDTRGASISPVGTVLYGYQ